MGYWKKQPKKCYHQCKPYAQLFTTGSESIGAGEPLPFNDLGEVCGFGRTGSSVIDVTQNGVYFVSFQVLYATSDIVTTVAFGIEVNGVIVRALRFGEKEILVGSQYVDGSGLVCLKCGDKVRLVNLSSTDAVKIGSITPGVNTASLTLFKVN